MKRLSLSQNLARLWVFVLGLGLSQFAGAYPIGPAQSLDKLTEMAPLIVKAKAISSEPVRDPWFREMPIFECTATKFQVISVLKGEPGAQTITFHHYAFAKTNQGYMYEPQHYEFVPGRSYILFATNGGAPTQFRQLWANHTMLHDQGVLLAPNDQPIHAKSVKEAIWAELNGLLARSDIEDVVYAIRQLDAMSSGGENGLQDFSREEVAQALRPVLKSKDEKITSAAINAVGSHNPYLESDLVYWLVTVGKGHLPGVGGRNPKFDNFSGRLLWRELVAIANGNGPATVRARAIRALAKTGVVELTPMLKRWAEDEAALVRQSAVLLLADVPDEAAEKLIEQATKDEIAEVRKGAAQAIGCSQRTALVPLLAKLLKDDSEHVRAAAAMSLLSFSIDINRELLRQNLNDPDYHCLFVNALAASDPAPYVEDLQKIINENPNPKRWWGGRIVAADSWDILYKFIQSRPPEDLRSGKFNTSMDALESMRWYSSSEPRDLYALYLQRGLNERAKTFRQACRQKLTYNIDYFFDMADKSPGTYQRQ